MHSAGWARLYQAKPDGSRVATPAWLAFQPAWIILCASWGGSWKSWEWVSASSQREN